MSTIIVKMAFILLFTVTLFSCKTAEEIRREQVVDTLSVQMVQNQKLAADLTVKLQDLEQKTQHLQGSFEETGYEQKQKQQEQIKAINDQIVVINESFKTMRSQVDDQEKTLKMLTTQLNDQKEFIEKVLKSLGKITGSETPTSKKSSPYDQAMASYQKGDYEKAKSELLLIVKNKSVKGNSMAKVLHHLGIISYMKKNCDEALVYFSKVFTGHSNSAYTPNSLLHIAKCLKEQNKNEEAKEALNELISKFPNSKRVKSAKQLLSEIK